MILSDIIWLFYMATVLLISLKLLVCIKSEIFLLLLFFIVLLRSSLFAIHCTKVVFLCPLITLTFGKQCHYPSLYVYVYRRQETPLSYGVST